MTTLADLLSPEQLKALDEAKSHLDGTQRGALKAATGFTDEEIDDLGGLPTTTINGVEYDLESEALVDTACADCQHPLKVEVAPKMKPADLELLISKPRIAVCKPCGLKRLAGQRGVLVHDARDFVPPKVEADDLDAHFAANADKVQTPVQKKKPKKKETELDLTKFSNAELATLAVQAREHMVAEAAAAMPAKRKKAEKERKANRDRDDALKAEAKADLKRKSGSKRLDAFVVKGVEVPALDLSSLSNLDEAPSSKERSPYNKALYRLGEPLLDKETLTYRVLRKVHKRLFSMADGEVVPELVEAVEKVETKVAEKRMVAVLDPTAKAKVKAFAEVTGMSKKDATRHLASLDLL